MGTDAQESPRVHGLRALKKGRTRAAIVHAATDLFAERGFGATTLAEIAAAAEIATSTLYTYFPTKSDIVFSYHAAVLESARRRFAERAPEQSAAEAVAQWVETELPALADANADAVVRLRPIIDASEELLAEERLRHALLEDALAEAFARDFGETADDLRSRLMGAVALAGLRAVWQWSYRHPRGAAFSPRDPYLLDATYLTKMLAAAEAAIEQIPRPV